MSTTPPTLNIPDILKMLPFSAEFRDQMLDVYPDKLDTERRIAFEQYMWKAFYLYFDLLYEENLQYMLEETGNNLPEGYHDKLLEKTHQQVSQGAIATKTNADIESIRGELQKLVTNPQTT